MSCFNNHLDIMTQSRFEEWINDHKISEVECLVADMNGTARGKILPPKKFLKGNRSRGLRIPEEIFTLTINGRYVQDTRAVSDSAIDVYLQPDSDTIRIVPWYKEPTAQVICDVYHLDDDPVDAKRDGLVDHVRLQRRVLTAVKHAQVHADGGSLLFHARQIGLEEVAGRKIAHQRDLDRAGIVEGRGHVGAEGKPRQHRDRADQPRE